MSEQMAAGAAAAGTAGEARAGASSAGAAGVLRAGDRVQLTDPKGRKNTIVLEAGKVFHTNRGSFNHDQLIGQPEATVVATTAGVEYLAMRPLVSDFVLSMPRGAAVVYPKDAGQIVQWADIFPGARVIEAGAGSGGLTLSLLRAVGPAGRVLSIERREEFAQVARGNVEAFFGGPHPAWRLEVGDFADVAAGEVADRVVLDMLAPWENVAVAAQALVPGGVLMAYVATTTQLSRTAEALRESDLFTEPQAWETMMRTWHLEGLAVRPDHRMIGHTGFLISARRMAPGVTPPRRVRRPAPGAYGEPDADGRRAPVFEGEQWTAADLGEREPSAKKLRRIRREYLDGPGQAGRSEEQGEA